MRRHFVSISHSTAAARLAALFLCAALLGGCALQKPRPQAGTADASASAPAEAGTSLPEASETPDEDAANAEALLALAAGARRPVDAGFFAWLAEAEGPDAPAELLAALGGGWREEVFYETFGKSFLVLHDEYTGADDYHTAGSGRPGATIAITGDINLADDWETMAVLRETPGGMEGCLSPALLRRMRRADILLVNNEFSFSDAGSAMAGKQYTFRAATGNVQYLLDMGVDLAGLANNHVYDYGELAFYDTLDTLQDAGIPTVGAGRNLAEAMAPAWFHAGGLRVAFVAASRAEKHVLTPGAEENSPGVLRCYEPELFLQAVAQARQNADVVIAYPHWGTENTTKLEPVQIELGQRLIDAGADAVVGAHPHCLQGIGWHGGKPVVYSLGNFWFNTNTVDTALLEITLNAPGDVTVTVQPCLQKGGVTTLLEDEADRQRIFRHLEDISDDLSIGEDGVIAPTE